MSYTTRDEPNPLRPYYKPPSIGIQPGLPAGNSTSSPPHSGTTHGLGARNGSAAAYASSARDMFSELDYSDYLSDTSPSSLESVQRQINEWTSRYFATLLSQPFEVAKTILQVKSQAVQEGSVAGGSEDGRSRSRTSFRDEVYNNQFREDEDEDSDGDEQTYFTSSAPKSTNYDSLSRSRQRPDSRSHRDYSPATSATPDYQLVLKRSDAIMEVISQEWTKEGAWGVWKASNATFIYGLLHRTLEKWAHGMFSALLNVPDQGLAGSAAELVDAQYPWASLGAAIAAAITAGLVLAPLDLVRTKLLVTPVSTPSRSLTQSVRYLPSYIIPSKLFLPTIFHEIISPTLHHTTTLLLRSHLSLDPILTPGTYSLAKFLSRTVELFVKLPFETVLRRAQVNLLAAPEYAAQAEDGSITEFEAMVPIGEYKGVFATMWCIAREEGVREEITLAKKGKKGKVTRTNGQGVEGLWRGWRVGMWGLVGVWGSGLMNGNANGGEF